MLPLARVIGITSLDTTAPAPPPSAAAAAVQNVDADFQSDDGGERTRSGQQQQRRLSYSGGIGTSSAAVHTAAGASPSAPVDASATPQQQQQEQQQPADAAQSDPQPESASPTAGAPEEEQETPIEEIVNRAIIHANKPIEHLPVISPPELKLIGRCVTFKGDTTVDGETRSFYYEGLVGTINKETVMLIHVQRYTEEDFQLHKLQLRAHHANQSSDKGKGLDTMDMSGSRHGGSGGAGSEGGLNTGDEPLGTTREEQEANRPPNAAANNDSLSDNGSSRANGNDFDFDPTGAAAAQQLLEPQLLNDLGETHAEATTRVRNRMRGHQGSMGPIPYVTFSRSHIHRVEFGIDPRSSFYSIFQDPTKLYFDMQCLRMFVRRYLIHTSQGNNPRLVPLRAFITCRCNCPHLDNDLLIQTTREELAHLIKIDRDVRRAKKKKEQGRRNVLRSYRAPNGIFRNTGVLYLTHVPRQTFTIGVMELLMLLIFLAYLIMSSTSVERLLVEPYVVRIYPYVIATVIVSMMATMCTLLHSVRMTIPVMGQIYLVAMRGLMTVGAVACSVMTMIVAGEMANLERWLRFYRKGFPQQRLCDFYITNMCSGFYRSCAFSLNASECQCDYFESPADISLYSCDTPIVLYIQRMTIPLVCMSFLIFITYLFDGYLHLRLFHISRLLERRM